MIRDIVVGLVLITYVFSSICCFTLIRELICDIGAAAVPELGDEFREYATHNIKFTLSTFLVSIIPVFNLVFGILLYRYYDQARASGIESLRNSEDWEHIQKRYNELLDLMEEEERLNADG